MSDPLEMPRQAARDMMQSARDTAIKALSTTADTALGRAVEALRDAATQDEVMRIRDCYVAGVVHLGSTPYVRR